MTNSQTFPCKIGDRIEVGNYFGTVKYIGPIEGKPSMWLGIDWDRPERGKHDGSLNGVQYFTSRNPTSGSFVRPERVNFGTTTLAAIESRYGRGEDEFTSRITQQKHLLIRQNMNAPFLEMVGFDKVFTKQSNFLALRVVNVREQNVGSAGPPFEVGRTCPNIEELDISKNLFASWEDVVGICEQLPKLRWLNVSENLLFLPDSVTSRKFNSLRTLICGSMDLQWTDVCRIGLMFPEIEEFRAPHNEISDLVMADGNVFTKLRLLDLEGNPIESWPEICRLGELHLLEQFILENVGLRTIQFEGSAAKVNLFKNLKKLCLVNNSLDQVCSKYIVYSSPKCVFQWTHISELNRLERLEHLKISKNPITESEDPDTVRQIIIAKIANLRILNSVEIEPGERRGAEYDYIKKYGLEWLKVKETELESGFLKLHDRFLELIQKYGEPEEAELVVKPKIIKTSLVDLKIVYGDRMIEKKMPPTMTVQKLMVLVQKLFTLSERPQLTYVSSTDDDIRFELEDELKEIGVYSMQNGDQIIVKM